MEPDNMDGRDSVQSLLVLRKLTRAITDAVRVQMTEYLKALTPLLRPKALLGDYVLGGPKEPSRKSDKAFGELQKLLMHFRRNYGDWSNDCRLLGSCRSHHTFFANDCPVK